MGGTNPVFRRSREGKLSKEEEGPHLQHQHLRIDLPDMKESIGVLLEQTTQALLLETSKRQISLHTQMTRNQNQEGIQHLYTCRNHYQN
jgi:hypothetical protein